MADRENTGPDVPRGEGGKWIEGGPSPNPGGRPRKLREIEAMLDKEHRSPEKIRETFSVLRKLALFGTKKAVRYQGKKVGEEIEMTPAYMGLYLDRILGPVKELLTDGDLRDAPDAVVEWLRSVS